MSSAERFSSVLHEVMIPLNSKSKIRTIRIKDFICQLSEGHFHRRSGDYKFNILVTGKTDNLTGHDLKKLFKY